MLLHKIASIALLIGAVCPILSPARTKPSLVRATSPETIALHEAEILIYLLPEARETRKRGMDIGWELETSPQLNQQDFFVFWVVNAKRKHPHGSVTIGFFSVNRHTADVWSNDLGKFVSTTELSGIQKILRTAHHIDQPTIEKFKNRRPDVLPPAP